MIVVDQLVALIDTVIAIELRGFPARQPVTITALQTFPGTSRRQAHATFMSDDDGCVHVARQATSGAGPCERPRQSLHGL